MFESGSFAAWLKQRRKQLHLTQAMLAARVGCAAETLRKIEAGRLRPSRDILERLAEQLQVPQEERVTFAASARLPTPLTRHTQSSDPPFRPTPPPSRPSNL